MPEDADVKEVAMDAPQEDGTRKRRRRRGRRATAKQDAESDATVVEKADAPPVESKPEAPKPVVPVVAAAKPPVVVLAPAKKKVPKVMLVPKKATTVAAKTFKKPFAAKRVHVVIDNTAKTQKRRRQTMQRVDAMTDDQVRASAVGSKLAKRETVAKVPIGLLRQMVKDYYTMRGMLL